MAILRLRCLGAIKITFTIPAGDFADGETTVTLKAYYFDNNESITFQTHLFSPFVRY